MQINIEQGDWGDAQLVDILRLLEDVAWQLLRYFVNQPTCRIQVKYSPNLDYPCVSHYTLPEDEYYVIWLATRDRYWCQYAYQFAHELCHVLLETERHYIPTNLWFHEALCELASIFVIKQMSSTWQTAPPYPNWRDYATSLSGYAENLVTRDERQLPPGVGLGEWFHINEPNLRADQYQRELNGLVAVHLLPLFQSAPEQWQSIRYTPNCNESFAEFLCLWHGACPDEHKFFILRIADLFGVTITTEA